MKIYLHLTSSGELNEQTVSILKEAGVLLVTNVDENYDADFSERELKRLKMTGENLLDKMDGFVIDATSPDPEVGYLLAYAMSQRKPVMYMVQKGSKLGKHIQRLPDTVLIREYSNENLQELLIGFLRQLEQGWGEAIPNIKFTLRITPQIERYMVWKAKKEKKTKADYMRDLFMDKLIPNDDDYQDYLHRK